MTAMHIRRHIARAAGWSAVTAALSAACTVGPNFVPPTPQAPAHWSARATVPPALPTPRPDALAQQPSTVTERGSDLRTWWQGFDDPLLSSLIERAAKSNLDLRAAVLRIEEARTQRAIAAAAYWPSLSLDASFSRERFSETTPTGKVFSSIGTNHIPGFPSFTFPNPYDQFQLSADASWEIDLFGRVRRSVEAAQASVQVSVEDQRAVLVSVLADVAQSYMELRGAQARLQTAKDNLTTIDELLDLTRQRRAAGLTTHIDVSNAIAQSAVTRAQLPAFELEITQSVNQLSQLLGLEPEALREELEGGAQARDASAGGAPAREAAVARPPAEVPIGLPAELARRRPDIREAEASLHAATAQIGVAVANLFPRLTLAANGGFQSEAAGNLIEWASRFGSLGPSLDVPLFDRGRWKTVRLYDVRAQEAALAYQRTVLYALHEVENALAAYAADQRRRAWLDTTVAQNRETLALSRLRYESGVVSFIDVLDAERTLQQNQLSLADSVTAVNTDLVRVYRALGGGWQQGPPPGG
jgi:outer membrane protein, multidrug efflux system